VVVEKLLEFFVGEVDTKLFKSVGLGTGFFEQNKIQTHEMHAFPT
jgi:hypothetical protein